MKDFLFRRNVSLKKQKSDHFIFFVLLIIIRNKLLLRLIDILFSNRGTLKRAFGEFSNSDISNDFYDIFRIFKLNCF